MNTTQPDTSNTARHRLLVVDDNPAIHEDFRKILMPQSAVSNASREMEAILFEDVPANPDEAVFELDSAFQGRQALEMVRQAVAEQRPYSLAFVDVRMPPGWDGIETVSHLWEVSPGLQVVVCTAYSDYSWQEMRSELGQPDNLVVLKKPFDNVEVQQLAHALTRKWELNLQAELKMDELERLVRSRTVELERTNTELKRSEERFAKAFETSPVAMAIQLLPGRRFVDVNARMCQLTGYTRDQLVGQCPSDLFLWKSPDLVDEWFAALARSELVRDQETEVCHVSGSLQQVLVSLSPVSLLGQPHVLLVAQDITERNLLERQFRQAQKMEAIGQLAAGVAHDFNNILTVIQGHAGLIKSHLECGRPAAEAADKITRASSHAASLIRQLLMFSRKQVMQFRYLDLNESINDSLGVVRRLVGEHIQLDFIPAASLPSIHADSTMLEQVVMNLAVNARDAMPNGGTVTIATDTVTVQRPPTSDDPEEHNGPCVRLSFRDTGCGMDTTVLNRLFEPFFTTKGVGKGTGLGLSTVFGIVRQHRGWIEVDSQPNQGTEFRVYFPASQQAAEHAPSRTASTQLLSGRETVLVAEDEDTLREMTTMVLSTQGYRVLAAASGVDALRVYEQAGERIDLLLTDMVMPGGVMGVELATRLRAGNPHLKVIFTSGYSPGMAGKELSSEQEKDFLAKPYSIGELAEKVRRALDAPRPDRQHCPVN